jgi:addiction module HigA family antidote
MHHPPHPGLTIRDDVLPALGLNVTQAAEQLGVSRVAFSRMINARAAISPEMALRLAEWLGLAKRVSCGRQATRFVISLRC